MPIAYPEELLRGIRGFTYGLGHEPEKLLKWLSELSPRNVAAIINIYELLGLDTVRVGGSVRLRVAKWLVSDGPEACRDRLKAMFDHYQCTLIGMELLKCHFSTFATTVGAHICYPSHTKETSHAIP